jgi:hypothetical protein
MAGVHQFEGASRPIKHVSDAFVRLSRKTREWPRSYSARIKVVVTSFSANQRWVSILTGELTPGIIESNDLPVLPYDRNVLLERVKDVAQQ